MPEGQTLDRERLADAGYIHRISGSDLLYGGQSSFLDEEIS